MRLRLLLQGCAVVCALVISASYALALDGTWSTIPAISGRIHSAMVYDPDADRLITVGGSDGTHKLNETWQMGVSNSYWTWSKMLFSNPLPGRIGHTAVYDAVGHRVIVFGGLKDGSGGDVRVNEVWALPLSGEWQQLTTTGVAVPATAWHSAVYDSRRHRMIVYGGRTNGGVTNNAYALDLSTLAWQSLFPNTARLQFHEAAYDSMGDQMVVFGGEETVGSTPTLVNKTFKFNAASQAWTQLFPLSPPPPLEGHVAVFDATRREFVVQGGAGTIAGGSTFRLPVDAPTQWNPVTSSTIEPRRQDHAAAYDSRRSRLLIFGGSQGQTSGQVGLIARNDTWVLPLTAAPQWTTTHLRPYAGTWFSEASMVYDPINQQTLLFGGATQLAAQTNELYALMQLPPDQWTIPTASGTPPPARYGHTAVYEYPAERMLVFGGVGSGGQLQDVWALNTGGGQFTWSQISPIGTPPSARSGHCAVLVDRVSSNHRMLVFGGMSGNTPLNDVWVLKLNGTPTWERLYPTGKAPSPRTEASAVYHSPSNTVFVFGGLNADGTVSNELFSLNLTTNTWTKETIQGAKPDPRWNHSAAISPYQDLQMVIFGGRGANGDQLGDAWAYSYMQGHWDQITLPLPSAAEREGAAAAYTGYGTVTIAGGFWTGPYASALENFNDTWMLTYSPELFGLAAASPSSATNRVKQDASPLSLRIASSDQSQIVLSLSRGGAPVAGYGVAIYDVAGRLLRRLAPSSSLDGRIVWDYRSVSGTRVGSGIFFARAEGVGSGLPATTKIIVVR